MCGPHDRVVFQVLESDVAENYRLMADENDDFIGWDDLPADVQGSLIREVQAYLETGADYPLYVFGLTDLPIRRSRRPAR